MSFIMVAHTFTGIAVVMSGASALLSSKGSTLHKLAGNLYVGLMLLMGLIIASSAWVEPEKISSMGLVFAFFINYLVLSAWHTIRNPESVLGLWDYLAPVVALCICVSSIFVGLEAQGTPLTTENTAPAGAGYFFATLAFLAMVLDANHLRVGGVRGKHRILRHVWRMSCALFFATSTLFTGPGSVVFPETIRDNIIFSIPQTLVVIVTLFWICKVFFSDRRSNKNSTSKTLCR